MWPEGTAVKDEGTHRDIINRAKQQVSMGVTVDLGFSLKHNGLIIQWLNDLWLLLRGTETQNTNKQLIFFKLLSFSVALESSTRPCRLKDVETFHHPLYQKSHKRVQRDARKVQTEVTVKRNCG